VNRLQSDLCRSRDRPRRTTQTLAVLNFDCRGFLRLPAPMRCGLPLALVDDFCTLRRSPGPDITSFGSAKEARRFWPRHRPEIHRLRPAGKAHLLERPPRRAFSLQQNLRERTCEAWHLAVRSRVCGGAASRPARRRRSDGRPNFLVGRGRGHFRGTAAMTEDAAHAAATRVFLLSRLRV